jgi:hypothetical protein
MLESGCFTFLRDFNAYPLNYTASYVRWELSWQVPNYSKYSHKIHVYEDKSFLSIGFNPFQIVIKMVIGFTSNSSTYLFRILVHNLFTQQKVLFEFMWMMNNDNNSIQLYLYLRAELLNQWPTTVIIIICINLEISSILSAELIIHSRFSTYDLPTYHFINTH